MRYGADGIAQRRYDALYKILIYGNKGNWPEAGRTGLAPAMVAENPVCGLAGTPLRPLIPSEAMLAPAHIVRRRFTHYIIK